MLLCKTFVCNPYQQNTYVVHKQGQLSCFIVDAGIYSPDEERVLTDYIRQEQLTVKAILITHAHPDHICGLERLTQIYPEAEVINYQQADVSSLAADWTIEVLRTPGHKEDCVCYYLPEEGVLFSGDTLFYGSVGRTDLPGGDYMTLMQSLNELMRLPAETKVYTGHGEPTTIRHEKQYNPFIG